MKTYSFLILFLSIAFSVSAQTSKTKNLLKEIEGFYEVDNSGNITYVRVFDDLNLTEKEIYDRANSYIVYKYNDANSVIQERNEAAGRIIGKGIFPNVHSATGLVTRYFSVVHIIRIDVKEGRCRVMLTLTEYKVASVDMYSNITNFQTNISATYPFNEAGVEKNFYGQAFYNSHFAAINTFLAFEKALREGVTFSDVDQDW